MRKLILTIAIALLTGTSLLASDYLVTGTLTPDATGTYVETGTSNGKPYYVSGIYFLQWWNDIWQITDTLGATDPSGWFDNSLGSGATPTVGAVYDPSGGYTGTANASPLFYVTGAVSPDLNGTYTHVGTFNSKPYFQNGSYYIYWVTGSYWAIDDTLGQSSGMFWYNLTDDPTPPLGSWSNGGGGATGAPVVSDEAPTPPASSGTQLPFTLGDGKTLINMVDE